MYIKPIRKTIQIVIVAILIFVNISPLTLLEFVIQAYGQHQSRIVDKTYLALSNPNVVDKIKGSIKKVDASQDSAELEYQLEVGPISGSTSSNYNYLAFFNPSGSGRTVLIKRLTIRSNSVAGAVFSSLTLRRMTNITAGTSISASDIPKMNSDSSNSIADIRHTIGTTGITYSGTTDSRIVSQTHAGATAAYYSVRDLDFRETAEYLVLKEGEGVGLYQEAAGDVDQRVRTRFEWEETATTPTEKNEYLFTFPRIEVAATAGYAYNTFFNPSGSGKTSIVKRVWFGSETCDNTAIYTNNQTLVRISNASAGTQITSTNIPKKNTSSLTTAMQIRRTGVTITRVGGTDARIGMVTPCAASGQAHGWQQLDEYQQDEQIIIKEGEGLALISETTGDLDQLTRMLIEWEEVDNASAPAAQGEYIFAYPRISDEAANPAQNTTFYTFFNPVGSGKTAVIKKLGMRVNADAAASYVSLDFRRLSSRTGGTQIAAADIPAKNTSTGNSAMELFYCGTTCASAITATYSQGADSKLLSATSPGAVAQVIGQKEIAFRDEEKLILKEGEGIGFYNGSGAADLDHYMKIYLEWDEEASSPASEGEYMLDYHITPAVATSGYTYASLFNPSGSGKYTLIKRLTMRIDTASSGVYIPMTIRRLTNATGGTQITAADIPRKNTSTANPVSIARRSGLTPTWSGTTDSKIITAQTPGAVGTSTTPSINAYKELIFENDDPIILAEGEGIGLYQEQTGDVDLRVKLLIEWVEVSTLPSLDGEFLYTSTPVTGSTSSSYVYSSFFNPLDAGKVVVIKRLELRADRLVGTPVVPTYPPISVYKVTDSSGGSLIPASSIPKKDTSIANTTAEVRLSNPTITQEGSADSRLVGLTTIGSVREKNDISYEFKDNDEFVLQPGEGIALVQESAAGDTFPIFRIGIQWFEVDITAIVSISVTDGTVGYGNVNVGTDRSTIELSDTQTVTNDGNVVIDLNIKGQDTACPWTLSSTAGNENYVHSFSINSGGAWTPLTTSYQQLSTALSVSDTMTFDLKIAVPTVTTCYTQQSTDVTVQAIQ